MLRVTINGKPRVFEPGISILDAVRSSGIELPAVCHDDRLIPYGGCRLCSVEVEGSPRPVTACTTPLADNMRIETHSPEIVALRKILLRMLVHDYPADALARFPDKEFHRYLREYGITDLRRASSDPARVDATHPYIHVDMTRCILCYRCVRICSEVQGQFVWRVWQRGAATRIVPDSGTVLAASSCVSCGACVDTCPTGALEDQNVLTMGEASEWTRTTCPYCGVGCELLAGTRQGRLVQVRPVADAPVSKGHLCVKGRYAHDFVYAADRVLQPMVRKGDKWQVVSWEEAIVRTAETLRRIVEQHGPDSVGVLGSARATNEENYLAQKFARVVIGTNNVDCCARVCHAPSASAMRQMLGTGAATSSFDDIERARLILLCGTNATENHPIVGARIKQAVLRGARLIVIDPRRIELAEYADVHLPVRPGTNVLLLNAMACALVEDGLYDRGFLQERVDGWEAYCDFIRAYTPERVAAATGVEPTAIRRAACLYATEKPAISFHGLGMTEHVQGTEAVMCLVNLALLTGNIGKPGTGVNPLRGQNNVQGSAHMGCEPSNLTGFVSLAEGRPLFESVWGASLPTSAGLDLMQMVDAAAAGRLKALWAIGFDVFLTNPNATATRRAFQQMECVVIQDLFLNETAKEFGTIFLPCVSSFEKDGTFMNSERRVQRVRAAIAPLGNAKPDWEILCLVARAMGRGDAFPFRSPEEVWEEVRRVWKAGAGISYGRLEHGGLQWPCPTEDHPGTVLLHREEFASGHRVALRCIDFLPSPEVTNDDFPFLLVTGRTLYHFNAGTMTSRTKNSLLRPSDVLDISPRDAQRLGLQEGTRVRICSRYGEAVLPVHLSPAVRDGEVFATFHTAEIFLNRVTGPYRDTHTHTPEYKLTAIRIERA